MIALAAFAGCCAWHLAARRRRGTHQIPHLARKWRAEVRVAAHAARACGRAIIRAGHNHTSWATAPSWKGAAKIDPCTATDEENEALVRRAIASAFPHHAIIGEESSAAMGEIPALGLEDTWIVDPIDGTQNFVHGMPLSVVSLGLCVNRIPTVGVVYNPHSDELFVGVRGEGAWCNGERITCKAGAKRLDEALVIIDPAYERSPLGVRQLAAQYLGLLGANTRAIRAIGTSVYAIALVACGRASGFVIGVNDGDSPKPWDWCAAAVIAREAGAVLRMVDNRRTPPGDSRAPAGEGDSFDLFSRSGVCAATPELADALQQIALEAIAVPVDELDHF